MKRRIVCLCAALALAQWIVSGTAQAGTTGALIGRVLDSTTHQGLGNATVSVASPSQTASTITDASGAFRFLSLAPDTYVLSVTHESYDPASLSGVTVLADQTQNEAFSLAKTLRTIGRVTARSASELVKPGTTSDVYSVNAAGAEAASALGGPGGLNSAYSAIASVPGAVVQQGQQGWYQTVNIRGGDIDQVGYELDGIPVNRVYDNAPQTMLSNIGQQELQVYTGGTPASAEASGIAGYINQVIRTGTYPGFGSLNLGIGGPTFYHKASFEIGGATPNRLFTYYIGFAGVNQDYRYVDQFNGVSDPQLFYPIFFPEGRFNFWDGTGGKSAQFNFAPGPTLSIANTTDRENVVNLHFGIPHHNDSYRDDVQLLYLTSEMVANFFSSINDQGGPANVANAVGNNGQGFWHDGYVYNGPLFAAPNAADVVPYFFQNSPHPRPLEQLLAPTARDYTDNGVALTKVQYQRNFSPKSYLRLYGYTEYSNWFIGGPANQQFTSFYSGELNDYELPSHTYGFNASYANQLSDKHLLTATASYTAAQVQRRFTSSFPGNTLGFPITNLVDTKTGFCYDPTSGAQTSCFNSGARGTLPTTIPNGTPNLTPTISSAAQAAFSAAGVGPQWLVTDNGFVNTRLNQVSPVFTATSLTDQWRPNDRLTINAGLRIENYDNRLGDTGAGGARQFWFAAYDREFCYKPGAFAPRNVFDTSGVYSSPTSCVAAFGPGYLPANLVNTNPSTVTKAVYEPRFGFTYSAGLNTVVRGSYGIYTRPVNTSWLQYNAVNMDLASFIGNNFLTAGYNTPTHQLQPDTSYNADISLEHQFRGTDLSFKLTPFYRSTQNQLQPIPIGSGGVVSGFNVGQQTSTGIELAVRKGDFARDGFSAQLAYTYTHSRIKYNNFPSGTNVIDSLNQYVQEYNSYTSACATVTSKNAQLCGLAPGTSNPNAVAAFPSSSDPTTLIANPYFGAAPQPLFDRNGSYTTYDQIPQPFIGENGYETPHVLSLILNYRHQRWAVTPSLTFSSGAFYGSPLAYPGYIPSVCSALGGASGGVQPADPKTCGGSSIVTGNSYILIPDAFTGRFDNLGAFQQPSRLTLNFSTSYEATKNVKVSFALTGLVDKCFQRGYRWDDSNICVYSELPSGANALGPSGNFVPIASTPIQLRYPYGVFNNNLNTGFLGTVLPLQATANVQIKL